SGLTMALVEGERLDQLVLALVGRKPADENDVPLPVVEVVAVSGRLEPRTVEQVQVGHDPHLIELRGLEVLGVDAGGGGGGVDAVCVGGEQLAADGAPR